MTFSIQNAGTLRTITRGRVRIAGVTRELRAIKVQDGGTLRTVATFAVALTASTSPTFASGQQDSASPTSVNTDSTTASPAGGRAPFAYSWANIGGVDATANSPTMATTSFNFLTPPGTSEATFRVTITDADSQTATAEVVATFFNLGGGGLE